METLSTELIDTITSYCGTAQDKARLGRLNRRYYDATRRRLFQTVTITSPRQYQAFVSQLAVFQRKDYLRYVRKLDLSSYTVRGSGWTEEQAKSVVVASELAALITVCQSLQQLVIGDELMYVFVEPCVMRAIFTTDHPFLQVIDFTGFCDQKVTQAMADLFHQHQQRQQQQQLGLGEYKIEHPSISSGDISPLLLPSATTAASAVVKASVDRQDDSDAMEVHQWKMPPRLTQLSFHLCMALSPTLFFQPFFERLATNGNTITRLDLAYTPITNQVFTHVNPSTLTHLNLQGCRGIYCCRLNARQSSHWDDDQVTMAGFLRRCTNLVELNLNMHFNGTAMGTQFCASCLSSFLANDLKHMRSLRVLDLGGQAHLSDAMLNAISFSTLAQLHYFSVAYASTRLVTLDTLTTLLSGMHQLEYLNVAKTNINVVPRQLSALLHHCNQRVPSLQVLEVDGNNSNNKMASSLSGQWMFTQHGRRGYYGRQGVDPRFKYSQKLLLLDEQPQSPMMKYWSFSY